MLMKNPSVLAVLGNNEKNFIKRDDVSVYGVSGKNYDFIFTDGKQEFEIAGKDRKLKHSLRNARSKIVDFYNKHTNESVITEKQFKGLDGIDVKTPLTKISDVQKLKIIQSTGNIISFFVPKGFDRNFWQVISKGKIKKGKDLSGGVVYILTGKMINSPKFKSIKDLIKGVDWASVEKSRRFNESNK
jgi:hypothetical protein